MSANVRQIAVRERRKYCFAIDRSYLGRCLFRRLYISSTCKVLARFYAIMSALGRGPPHKRTTPDCRRTINARKSSSSTPPSREGITTTINFLVTITAIIIEGFRPFYSLAKASRTGQLRCQDCQRQHLPAELIFDRWPGPRGRCIRRSVPRIGGAFV